MEINKNESHSRTKALLTIIGILAGLVVALCLSFHLTPLGMCHKVADYAAHHYFSVGFISALIAIGCWRSYTTMEAEFKKHYAKKKAVTRSRRKRKWFERRLISSERSAATSQQK